MLNQIESESNPATAAQTRKAALGKGRSADDRIMKTAREFEAMFAGYMLKNMNNAVQRDPLVKKSMGESVFQDMLMDEYAKTISENGSFGLSGMLYRTLKNDPATLSAYTDKMHEYNAKKYAMQAASFTNGDFGEIEGLKNRDSVDVRMKKLEPYIRSAARRNGVDADLVAAVIRQESGGDAYAVSQSGAKGLMQLMDSTARELGVRNVFDRASNIEGGTRYLKKLLASYNNDLELALAAYNAGPEAVAKHGGVPPYPETRNYVDSVMALYQSTAKGATP